MHQVAVVVRGFKAAGSAIEHIVQTAAGRSDLSLAHWLIVVHLLHPAPHKQGEVNTATGITAGHLTRLLDELDAKGLIHRHRSTEDRRQILLSLSEAGTSAALSLLAALDRRRLPQAFDALKASLDKLMDSNEASSLKGGAAS